MMELRPAAPYYLPQPGGVFDTVTPEPPVIVAGGSQADDSDATYIELGQWYDGTTSDFEHCEMFSLDFPPVTGTPTRLLLSMRLANAHPAGAVSFDGYSVLSNAADPAASQIVRTMSQEVRSSLPPSPTWVHWSYDGFSADPADPETWLDVESVYPQLAAALTGAGVRVTTFPYANVNTTREPYWHVYEYRLTVLVDGRVAILPPLRQDLCRDDSRVGRIWPASSQQDSLRRLGGYY